MGGWCGQMYRLPECGAVQVWSANHPMMPTASVLPWSSRMPSSIQRLTVDVHVVIRFPRDQTYYYKYEFAATVV